MSTPTPTIERPIADVIEDYGLEQLLGSAVPPPTCEYVVDDLLNECGEPAAWIMTLSCGHSAYFDDEHVETIKSRIDGERLACCETTTGPRHRYNLPVTVRFDRIAS